MIIINTTLFISCLLLPLSSGFLSPFQEGVTTTFFYFKYNEITTVGIYVSVVPEFQGEPDEISEEKCKVAAKEVCAFTEA